MTLAVNNYIVLRCSHLRLRSFFRLSEKAVRPAKWRRWRGAKEPYSIKLAYGKYAARPEVA